MGYKKRPYNMRYLPKMLSVKDKVKQTSMLNKSRKLYKNHKYYVRMKLASFKNKRSKHIMNAMKKYGIKNMTIGKELAAKTGCSISALKQIVRKGEGAYYSSGSRPNQTARSWGLARLGSALTAGKSAAVDFNIIDKGCNHNKSAYKMALKAKKKYGFGHGTAKKTYF